MAKTINMECPICKKKVLFVGVHDDEGNYHGLVGCEYENDPWSGLSYALHHEGWGDCPLCTDGAYSTMGGMLFDAIEEAISALRPVSREQVEKVWRGEWEWYDEEVGSPLEGIDREWGWRCSKCKVGLPDDFDDPDNPPAMRFCQWCGAPMTDEAVEMVMERLGEAMYEQTEAD